MIRYANASDRDAVIAMGRRFYASIPISKTLPHTEDALHYLFHVMLNDGVLLIAEDENGPCGVAGLVLIPYTFNPEMKVASEILWWVNPESQGSGIGKQLLEAIEPACKTEGADLILMIHLKDSPPQAKALYERMGYQYQESSYIKVM